MKILIVIGKENHIGRLVQGMGSTGSQIFVTHGPQLPTEHFDIIFIDHSYDFHVPKLNYGYLFLFDCEDDPLHFSPGIAYHELKDKAHAYAKLVYKKSNTILESLKQIAFPIDHYLKMAETARIDYPNANIDTPFFVGVPTFIGRYEPKPGALHASDERLGIRGIGWIEESPTDKHHMYNQRVEWLLSLYKSDIKYVGGLAFGPSNQSLEWQTKYFGNVELFKTNQIPKEQFMNNMRNHKIHLLPTGYDRIGWRVYDAMALGNIMMMTDIEDREMLILPKEYVLVKDGEDIATIISDMMPAINEIHKKHKINKEFLASLTPDKIINMFLSQLEK